MTNVGDNVKRPGATITKTGLLILLIGILLTVVSLAGGGTGLGPIVLSLIGLVVAVIGFGKRVLAALER
jgi:hypothetical protein